MHYFLDEGPNREVDLRRSGKRLWIRIWETCT